MIATPESIKNYMNNGKVEMYQTGLNRQHCDLIPTPFKCIIVGKTNSGKTHLLLRLLLGEGILDYDTVHLISNSCEQDKYMILKQLFSHGLSKLAVRNIYDYLDFSKRIIENINSFLDRIEKKDPIISFNCYRPTDPIPDPNQLDPELKHIVIFDDMMENKNQTIPKSYFTRGRHNNADCFYIAQNYLKVDRQSIRTNANLIIMFKQPKKDLQQFYSDYVQIDIKDYKTFEDFCNRAWEDDYGYTIIEVANRNKYRIGWDGFHNFI